MHKQRAYDHHDFVPSGVIHDDSGIGFKLIFGSRQPGCTPRGDAVGDSNTEQRSTTGKIRGKLTVISQR